MSYTGKKIVIAGGGVAGVSAAAFALQQGFSNVTIIESSKTLGGLHKDVEINGLHYDLGAFFFWPFHSMMSLFPGITNLLVATESTKHLSLTRKFNLDVYPLTLKQYIKENGLGSTVYDILRLFRYRLFHNAGRCTNADELLTYYMGFFYRKTGLKNYIRRLYNMDPEEIGIEFCEKRLGFILERFKMKSFIHSFIRLKWKNFNRFTIAVNAWARPETGFKTLYAYIETTLRKNNCAIIAGDSLAKIHTRQKRMETASGKILEYDYLISSMPLAATGQLAGIPFEGALPYKALCSLFYESKAEPVPGCFVLYNFSENGNWKRITFHSAYYNQQRAAAVDARHYFVVESMPDDIQTNSSNMAALLDRDFKDSFSGTKWEVHFSKAVLAGHHITLNAYPVLDIHFEREKVLAFKETMREMDIYMAGRQGEFEYVSSSDASEAAINAVKDIMEQAV